MAAKGAAGIISIDKIMLNIIITVFEENVSIVKDFVSNTTPAEIGEGSEVLTEYALALEKTMNMLGTLTDLLAQDASSYKLKTTRIMTQDR